MQYWYSIEKISPFVFPDLIKNNKKTQKTPQKQTKPPPKQQQQQTIKPSEYFQQGKIFYKMHITKGYLPVFLSAKEINNSYDDDDAHLWFHCSITGTIQASSTNIYG